MLFKVSKEKQKMLDNLRKMETLKVNDEGGISVEPNEILNREEFKISVRKSREFVKNLKY